MSKFSLDDPVTKRAVELYLNGASLTAAAAAIYLTRAGLVHRFKVLGIPLRETYNGKKIPPEIAEAVRREYVPYKNGFLKLAKKYGISTTTVKNYVKKG